MDDPNAYIDIPQALGRLDQPSLTRPEQKLNSICPDARDFNIDHTSPCLVFFDRKWMQATINELTKYNFEVIKKFNKLGLTFLKHKQVGHIFIAFIPWGAPAATCRLEEFRAMGIRKFLVLGIGGRLQTDHPPGTLYLIDQAIRDEGTSLHYLERSIFAHASFKYSNEINRQLIANDIEFIQGLSWTTDAPYRETLDKFLYWQKKVCLTVEMELAALFSLGKYHKLDISALIVGADQLTVDGWIDCFNNPEITRMKEKVSMFLGKQYMRHNPNDVLL